MILSNVGIREALETGKITIDPEPDDYQYGTSSLDLRLGSLFRRFNPELVRQPGVIPAVQPDQIDYRRMTAAYTEDCPLDRDGQMIVNPGDFMLGITRERISLPKESTIAARVEGRSTFARLGLSVHLTAPTVHLGFRGRLALELKNHGDLKLSLTPGMTICQLIFEQVRELPSAEMSTVHQGQNEP